VAGKAALVALADTELFVIPVDSFLTPQSAGTRFERAAVEIGSVRAPLRLLGGLEVELLLPGAPLRLAFPPIARREAARLLAAIERGKR
jgi:hypothetical protein